VRRVSFIAIAVLVLLGLAPAEAGAQPAALASSNGAVVFGSDRDGEPDLFTIDPSTSAVTKLTTRSGAAELQPAWSPDGGRIVYVRRGGITGRPDLWVMKASGRGRTRVTSTPVPERDPSWSPDGTHLIYAARTGPGEPFRIFVANDDGSGPDQLTTQAAGSADRSPVWSPDGSRIAFVSNRAGGFPELYLMSAAGTGLVRLTTNSSIDANPSWSPDGTRLLFERCCENGTSDLFTIDVATRAEVNLTPSSTQQDFDPVWSPDGTRIAFVSFAAGQGNLDIWVMNADGTAPMRLTQEAGPDLSPHWQPIPV
jgi:Tol biopolymer transport system component